MGKVSRLKVIPKESDILYGFSRIDYADVYEVKKATNKTAKEVAIEILQLPNWVILLLKLRNVLVKPFGVKVGKQNDGQETFFTLVKESENEAIMGESDKHLDFRASVVIEKSKESIAFITVVHFNNFLGKIYLLLIKPFHKIILRSLLKRQLKRN